jgi:hypothetical protein
MAVVVSRVRSIALASKCAASTASSLLGVIGAGRCALATLRESCLTFCGIGQPLIGCRVAIPRCRILYNRLSRRVAGFPRLACLDGAGPIGMRPPGSVWCSLAFVLLIVSGCSGSGHQRATGGPEAAAQRYTQLHSCLTRAGLIGRAKSAGGWPRKLVMASNQALVDADVFETEAGARKAAAEFQKNEAAYLRRGRDAGISPPTPTRPPFEGNHVFARYIARSQIAPAILQCLRG